MNKKEWFAIISMGIGVLLMATAGCLLARLSKISQVTAVYWPIIVTISAGGIIAVFGLGLFMFEEINKKED